MTALGELALWLALLLAAWGAALSFAGAAVRRADFAASGARGLHAATGFIAVGAAALWTALLHGDVSLRYVAAVTDAAVPMFYRITAFWAGGAGMLLLWSLLVAACASLVLLMGSSRVGAHDASSRAAGALGVILVVSLASLEIAGSPFGTVAAIPADVHLPDPRLQQPALALYLPLLMAGCSALATAAAFGVAARAVRGSWVLAGWALLTLALDVEAFGAYVSAGGPTAPAYDPAFAIGAVAWIAATVYLGRVLVRSRRSGTRRSRRGAWALVTLAVALLVAGAAGRAFTRRFHLVLTDGQIFAARDPLGHDWTFTSQGMSRMERPTHFAFAVALLPQRAGAREPFLSSEYRAYADEDVLPPVIVPGIRHEALQDVYLRLEDVTDEKAGLYLAFRPMISCLWIGGALLAAGGLALFRSPEETA